MKKNTKRVFMFLAMFLFCISLPQGLGSNVNGDSQNDSDTKPKQTRGKVTCVICHNQLGKEKAQWVKQWQESVHGKNNVTCPACHGGDPSSFNKPKIKGTGYLGKPSRIDIPEFCSRCHANPSWMRQYNKRTDQFSQYKTSKHGKGLFQNNDTKVATCVDCHGKHNIAGVNDPASLANHKNIAETCATCHGDPDYMLPYGLPSDQLTAYYNSYHGMIMKNKIDGKNPSLVPSCPDCHSPHGAKPPDVPEVPHVCGNCHMQTAKYFYQGEHKSALEEQNKPRCIDCHSYHEIRYPTTELFVGESMYHCGFCHLTNSDQYLKGIRIKEAIEKADREIDKVESMVLSLQETPGLDVIDLEGNLQKARRNVLEAIPRTHSLREEDVIEFTGKAINLTRDVEKTVDNMKEEFITRKKGLFAALMVIFFLICILLYKRWLLELKEEEI
ncbi:MAG: hypothetical protein ACMUIA_02415 [bacterium]